METSSQEYKVEEWNGDIVPQRVFTMVEVKGINHKTSFLYLDELPCVLENA